MPQNIFNTVYYFLPEISLAISVLILNVFKRFLNEKFLSILFISSAFVSFLFSLLQINFAEQYLFHGAFAADSFALASRIILTSVMTLNVLLFYRKPLNIYEIKLSLLLFIGSLLSASASNIFVMYIGFQLMIIPLIVTGNIHNHYRAKLFITYGLFSAVLLFGLTILYALTGSSNYLDISNFLSHNPYNILALTSALILIISAIAYFSGAAPFNLLSVSLISKSSFKTISLNFLFVLTSLIILTRFIYSVLQDRTHFAGSMNEIFPITSADWQLMIVILAVFTITISNLGILWQYDLKKIFSFAISINCGYLFLGIAAFSQQGINTAIYLLIIFALNAFGLLAVFQILKNKFNINSAEQLKNFKSRNIFLSIMLLLFLIQFSILPAGGGFISKILILSLNDLEIYIAAIVFIIFSSLAFIKFIFNLSVRIFNKSNGINIDNQIFSFGTTEGIILLILTFADIAFALLFGIILIYNYKIL